MRIALLSNTAWYLYNFRSSLIEAISSKGHTVITIAQTDEYKNYLQRGGNIFHDWSLKTTGTNPVNEIMSIIDLGKILRKENIDILLTFTPKGNIYGSLAAFVSKTIVISNISGLGQVFIRNSLIRILVEFLYRLALSKSTKVFFQNTEDMELFINHQLVSRAKVLRLPGSGVNLQRFSPTGFPNGKNKNRQENGNTTFLLSSRLLLEKGIVEFITAARQVKKEYPQSRYLLLGFMETDNPSAISSYQIAEWEEEGLVKYLGASKDVVPILNAVDCFVLPSYYGEGVPKSLLEAASMCLPIITTDHSGCRDAIDDAVSGYLCEKRNPEDLADKMRLILGMSNSKLREMGANGRQKMILEFDEKIIINRYLKAIKNVGMC
jgi:glycosyltransferase involved in cell wall biosynthesis